MSTIMRDFFRIVCYKRGGSYNKKVFGDVFLPEKFFLGDDLEVLRVFMGDVLGYHGVFLEETLEKYLDGGLRTL